MTNNEVVGKIIGDIHINVCEAPNDNTFFYVQGSNKNVLPVIDYVETSLENYKKIKRS